MDNEFRFLEKIKVGAEAEISLVDWRGIRLVAKTRLPKPYRHPDLDREVRTRRMLNEARVMVKSKRLGVPCPTLIHVDYSTCTLYMQYVEGEDLRGLLSKRALEAVKSAESIGYALALMHEGGIYHGDAVPSNIIMIDSRTPVFIDFGLSGFSDGLEEKAIDIHLLQRSLQSFYPELVPQFMEALRKGYTSISGDDEWLSIEMKVEEIRRRARYVKRGREDE